MAVLLQAALPARWLLVSPEGNLKYFLRPGQPSGANGEVAAPEQPCVCLRGKSSGIIFSKAEILLEKRNMQKCETLEQAPAQARPAPRAPRPKLRGDTDARAEAPRAGTAPAPTSIRAPLPELVSGRPGSRPPGGQVRSLARVPAFLAPLVQSHPAPHLPPGPGSCGAPSPASPAWSRYALLPGGRVCFRKTRPRNHALPLSLPKPSVLPALRLQHILSPDWLDEFLPSAPANHFQKIHLSERLRERDMEDNSCKVLGWESCGEWFRDILKPL
ncbi:hypothetical protein MC885_014246 [Smutsia gigantea]|nr:hypothetical protein MC885_014246 [Smutsia gigantea]